MNLTTSFTLQEFIHPDIYKAIGDMAKNALHPNLAPTCQVIKDACTNLLGHEETVTINNWSFGGKFVDSGLRLPNGDVGAKFSAHKFGYGADLKFKHMSSIDVQDYIIANQSDFPYISRMENARITKTWLHIEVGDYRAGDIIVFNP